jgi:transcriptional regulator with XRE-family HTH domain
MSDAARSSPAQLRELIRGRIRAKFDEIVTSVKRGDGTLADAARQIGVTRQALSQYAQNSVPQSDVLLMALLKWGWTVRIENDGGEPEWFEFSLSGLAGGLMPKRPEPVQLSLFDALEDLDRNLATLRKSVGRVEAEVQKAFGT